MRTASPTPRCRASALAERVEHGTVVDGVPPSRRAAASAPRRARAPAGSPSVQPRAPAASRATHCAATSPTAASRVVVVGDRGGPAAAARGSCRAQASAIRCARLRRVGRLGDVDRVEQPRALPRDRSPRGSAGDRGDGRVVAGLAAMLRDPARCGARVVLRIAVGDGADPRRAQLAAGRCRRRRSAAAGSVRAS